jgi:hypothetical protein
VFEFINGHVLPPEFSDQKAQDVKIEDILKVKKVEKDKNGEGGADDVLPQMVREYIIHDRGNSLFLSDSFGNLPSPVNESKTIKNLFKNKDDDDLKK